MVSESGDGRLDCNSRNVTWSVVLLPRCFRHRTSRLVKFYFLETLHWAVHCNVFLHQDWTLLHHSISWPPWTMWRKATDSSLSPFTSRGRRYSKCLTHSYFLLTDGYVFNIFYIVSVIPVKKKSRSTVLNSFQELIYRSPSRTVELTPRPLLHTNWPEITCTNRIIATLSGQMHSFLMHPPCYSV